MITTQNKVNKDQTIKGDGASCAHCGNTPKTRFAFKSQNWLTLVWACNEEHAKAARFN